LFVCLQDYAEKLISRIFKKSVLTEGFPLPFGAPFSIVICVVLHHVDILLKKIHGWMDGWMETHGPQKKPLDFCLKPDHEITLIVG